MHKHNDVLIIEDHPFVAHSTRELISRTAPRMVVTVCKTAAEALAALDNDEACWHRILLDLGIPGAYGLSLAQEIRKRHLQGIACVVTAMDRQPELVAAVRAMGFLGYLFKAMPVDEFCMALGAVFRGETVFPAAKKSRATPSALRLTQRQVEVLHHVRRGYSSKQIAVALSLTDGTVNNYINTILAVLSVTTRSQAVAKAIEHGWIPFGMDDIQDMVKPPLY